MLCCMCRIQWLCTSETENMFVNYFSMMPSSPGVQHRLWTLFYKGPLLLLRHSDCINLALNALQSL